jgi:hypothetical protein
LPQSDIKPRQSYYDDQISEIKVIEQTTNIIPTTTTTTKIERPTTEKAKENFHQQIQITNPNFWPPQEIQQYIQSSNTQETTTSESFHDKFENLFKINNQFGNEECGVQKIQATNGLVYHGNTAV